MYIFLSDETNEWESPKKDRPTRRGKHEIEKTIGNSQIINYFQWEILQYILDVFIKIKRLWNVF